MQKGYTVCVESFSTCLRPAQVSEKDARCIAEAFWDEFSPFLSTLPPSAKFIVSAATLSKTGHENRLTDSCISKFGLSADVETSFLGIGLTEGSLLGAMGPNSIAL